jgi:hypothetical protein
VSDIQHQLDTALNSYQWSAAAAVGGELIRRVYETREPYPEASALAVLASLRRKRQFPLAVRVAEAFLRTGQVAPRVHRQYAQALIDQGILFGAETVLQALLMQRIGADGEVAEAHGLLGRIYKQLYVNAAEPAHPRVRGFLERALGEYLQVYRQDPKRHTWHGVNAVALLHRAKADGIELPPGPSADSLAAAILDALPAASAAAEAFDLATRVEALLALGRTQEAILATSDYVSLARDDAFAIASTLRQMEEVWRLNRDTPPGSTILMLLSAALLRAQGGESQTFSGDLTRSIAAVDQAKREVEKVEHDPDVQYQRILGNDGAVSLGWLKTGLQRARSIARIERLTGDGHGTGWLVRAEDFFPGRFPAGRLLLVTNTHVVNQDGSGDALSPGEAQANFQGVPQVCPFAATVVWSSPVKALDATFLDFGDAVPSADPLPLSARSVTFTEPPPRMFIIGHPQGGDVKFSIHDNRLLDYSDNRLRYRTPTEPGSSGSPVFDSEAWHVVALHHAAGKYSCLSVKQKEPYEANEGIPVQAIRNAIAAG